MPIRPAHLASLVLLSACGGVPAQRPITSQRDTVILAAGIPPFGTELGTTLLDSAIVDVDGDGTAESIELGVNAARDEQGRWSWDAHPQWSVVVRDGPASYPLLMDYVGPAAFWVIPAAPGHPAEILVQTSTLTTNTGGTRLEKFVFDRRRGGYVRTGVLEGFGRGARYRGPPAYAETTDLFPPTSWRGEDPAR
jgi:hypothetical protein